MPVKISSGEKLWVYVPTRGRVNKQTSMEMMELERLDSENKIQLVFVVPECEFKQFKIAHFRVRVVAVSDQYKIGSVLQYILTKTIGRRKVILDDDLSLIRRRDPLSISQKDGVANSQDLDDLFKRITNVMDHGFVHGGISLRQTNHFCTDNSFKENTRVSGMWFYDSSVVNQENFKFDDLQERSDFHFTLSMLELGYKNYCDYEFAIGQYLTKTNSPGGCSRYRTPEFLEEQAHLLAKFHPKSVKVVFKDGSAKEYNSMRNAEGKIPDVRIQWARSLGLRKSERKCKDLSSLVKVV